MPRSTLDTQHPRKWALALRREMQKAIGQQLRAERGVSRELQPNLATLLTRRDREDDPYADIVGTCWKSSTQHDPMVWRRTIA
jgi:hypothetical protein